MGFLRLSLFIFMPLLFLFSQLHLSLPFIQPLCHRDESSALLQFKESFIINKSASSYYWIDEPTCQKVASWKVEGNKSDCCSWDGVECDEDTGHVIGLDLNDCCLKGSINSSSSLFRLVHLQSLNLAFNDFNYSQIPSQIRDLSRLTHLNLSSSHFSGQIPLEISQLSYLSSLDLSDNYLTVFDAFPSLELKNPGLRSIVGNLTRLEKLDLSYVNISSTVPNILANLSSLMVLSLGGCGLYGEFPVGIFKLSNLQILSVYENEGITGYLPGFTWSSPLETLELSFTNFSGELPAAMGNLGFLTNLLISGCNFSGFIPSSLGNLTKLVFLDLSLNAFVGNVPSSLGNLTKLVCLSLTCNIFAGNIPPSLGNLTKLTYLLLSLNDFVGNILPSIGNLAELTILELSKNAFIGNVPPSLGNLTKLIILDLSGIAFMGNVLPSLGNLSKLVDLDLSRNNFVGNISPSLGNLVQLSQLRSLDLSANNFHGQISNSIFNLKNLESLDLSENYLNGIVEFDEFVKLKHLTKLDISGNKLSLLTKETTANATLQKFEHLGFSSCNLSEFPNFLRNLDTLRYLSLSNNKIHGVPEWMWNTSTTSLEDLDLSNNSLTSFGQHPNFLPWTRLKFLNLTSNLLQGSLPIPPVSIQSFYISNNSLTGNIPELICNMSSLEVLDLANNNLSGSLPRCSDNFGASLYLLDLRRNNFQGSFPETWTKGSHLGIINFSQNKFQGHLPRMLAKSAMLKVLDLSDNQFDDIFPSWLKNLPNLEVLILRSNKFQGHLPRSLAECTMLKVLDLGNNQLDDIIPSWLGNLPYLEVLVLRLNKFQGQLPRSLTECTKLKVIDLSDNKFNGIFPFWLGNLSNLEVLILRSNKFQDPMGTIETYFKFPNMRILDISYNDFIGKLPLGFFQNWKAKNFENVHQVTYIQVFEVKGLDFDLPLIYTYSMMMTNKGKNMPYEKVQELFIAIDFSSNKFVGEIPKSIGNLKGAKLLNLSNNCLIGHIPSSLENLTELEALDLSQNKLSGEIPQQLTQLTFLAFLNVSHNNLTGLIPQGKQFNTFDNNSFEGNPGLCGRPLTRKCENSDEVPSQPSILEESQDSGSPFEFGWKIVVIGYGFGFVVGVIIGQIVIVRKHDWLMKTLRIRPVRRRRRIN